MDSLSPSLSLISIHGSHSAAELAIDELELEVGYTIKLALKEWRVGEEQRLDRSELGQCAYAL
uniref:Uncharacterized protein n=1 Tax=Oryza brachyantha TaxID=4533 RepID=J3ML77_ORYBR